MANVAYFSVPMAKRMYALNHVMNEMRKTHHQVANVFTTDTEAFVVLRCNDANSNLNGECCGLENSSAGLIRWYERKFKISGVTVRVRWWVKSADVVLPPDVLRRVH